jgi:hypothetical protein
MHYRTEIFSILQKAGIEAVANIELSRAVSRIGPPNNCVHFHLLTDDKRSEKKLRTLFENACKDGGLDEKDFRVDFKKIENGYWYFDYFTKFDRKSKNKYTKKEDIKEARKRDWCWLTVLLFEKKRGEKCLQKFYTIGKWYKKGRGKGVIWKEIVAIAKAEAAKKTAAKAEEKSATKKAAKTATKPTRKNKV